MAKKEVQKNRDKSRGRRAVKTGPRGLDPETWQGRAGFVHGTRATEPAARRTGQIRGKEPHGQGARQATRDPKDGGRPKGKRR